MKIPVRLEGEEIIKYSERLSELYARVHNTKNRKLKGEFFTPKEVSKYMASLFKIHQTTIRLLDPGSGNGILTAAFCHMLLKHKKTINLTIDAYENNPNLIPFLRKVLEVCKKELERNGHSVKLNIFKKDFILYNSGYFNKSNMRLRKKKPILFDFVISNPPYYKLNKDSPQSSVMKELIYGQPNIYALFMALSASMVKPEGEMVFITPRSFCSGLYYKKFREWFLENVQISNIHIFESRSEIFDKDEVLQENIIIKARKNKIKNEHEKLTISMSKNKDLNKIRKIRVQYREIIYHKNGDVFIRIPTSPIDVNILRIVDSWPNTLRDLGLEISTGPVVPFRAEDFLLPENTKNSQSAPLLWMHNMQDMKILWPLKKNKKASMIQVCGKSEPLLLPVKNYVLVKRFSSKEQERRLYTAPLLESNFSHKKVGIENHVNYVHRPGGNLSDYEAIGISAILNTYIVDNFFRSLNGNTQVNATDIRSLPFPKLEDIRKIGKIVHGSKTYRNKLNIDNTVTEILDINIDKINNLNRGEVEYGQKR